METEISSQQNKLTNQPTDSFRNGERLTKECQRQQQHQQHPHRANYRPNRETEKYQNGQQKPILQEQTLQ